MLFEFRLRLLEEVQPWEDSEKPANLSIDWFGLTDGWYWLNVGGERALFEYANVERDGRYMEYQVARLFQDLSHILASVLEPVPADLIPTIREEAGMAWYEKFERWDEQQGKSSMDGDPGWNLRGDAWEWVRRRSLCPLGGDPHIQFWSDEAMVYLCWDSRDCLEADGSQRWANPEGSYQLPRADFIAEVESFQRRLAEQMGERIERTLRGAFGPEVEIEPEYLREEQLVPTTPLKGLVEKPKPPENWERICRLVALVEAGRSFAEVVRELESTPATKKWEIDLSPPTEVLVRNPKHQSD